MSERRVKASSAASIAAAVTEGAGAGMAVGFVHWVAVYSAGAYILDSLGAKILSLAAIAGLSGICGAVAGAVVGAASLVPPIRGVLPRRYAAMGVFLLYGFPWVVFGAKEIWGRSAASKIGVIYWVASAILFVAAGRVCRFVPGAGRSGLRSAATAVCVASVLYGAGRIAPVGAPIGSVDREWRGSLRSEAVRMFGDLSERSKLDLLLITIDTLRADRLGCYGYPLPTSPSIDRLAESGVLFENALCTKPKTSPSVASFLTGLYPMEHGVLGTMELLREENVTLAEILSAEGWRCGAVITNGNIYPAFGFDQGFETYVYGHKDAATGAEKAIRWLEENGSSPPWFLWVHFTDPHAPYEPPAPFDTMFAGAAAEGSRAAIQRSLYDGEIRFTDEQVGRIVEYCRRNGFLDGTLVVFTADHGESLGEHDYYFEHGLHPYEPSARVPLIFSLAGAMEPGRISSVVSLVDLVPTILDVLGIPVPDGLSGRSFLPALLGDESRGGLAFIEAGYGEHDGPGLTIALRRKGTKFVHRLTQWAKKPEGPLDLFWSVNARIEGGLAADEYYELSVDPLEERDTISGRKSEALRDLAVIESHLRSLEKAGRAKKCSIEELDRDTYQDLKSLGYIR